MKSTIAENCLHSHELANLINTHKHTHKHTRTHTHAHTHTQTHTHTHSQGHISNNMFFLLTFGRLVEDTEGSFGVIFTYLACGVGARTCVWV